METARIINDVRVPIGDVVDLIGPEVPFKGLQKVRTFITNHFLFFEVNGDRFLSKEQVEIVIREFIEGEFERKIVHDLFGFS